MLLRFVGGVLENFQNFISSQCEREREREHVSAIVCVCACLCVSCLNFLLSFLGHDFCRQCDCSLIHPCAVYIPPPTPSPSLPLSHSLSPSPFLLPSALRLSGPFLVGLDELINLKLLPDSAGDPCHAPAFAPPQPRPRALCSSLLLMMSRPNVL